MYCTSNVYRKESSSPPGTAHGHRQQKSRMRALRCVVAASVLCSVASVDPMERLKTITGRAFDSAATGTDGASQEVRVWPRRELQGITMWDHASARTYTNKGGAMLAGCRRQLTVTDRCNAAAGIGCRPPAGGYHQVHQGGEGSAPLTHGAIGQAIASYCFS